MQINWRRFAFWSALALVLVFGYRRACEALNPCSNSVTASIVSPDQSKKLVVFVRDCGATTSFSSQVSLIDSHDKLPNDPGNLLVVGKKAAMQAAWTNDSAAVLTYPAKSEVFKQVAKLDGVSVTYKVEEINPPQP
jgi:hypothetical protein